MQIANLFHSAEKIINRIENSKINALFLCFYFAFLISLREVFEQMFFEKSYGFYQFLHHFFFCVLTLISGILLISIINKIDIIKTTLVVAAGYILIILPPLFDHFILLRSSPYEYILPREFVKNILTFFLSTPKAGLGILIELSAFLLLASFYVFLKTNSLPRTLLTGFFLYALMGLAATPRMYLPIPKMSELLIMQYRHVIYFCFYLTLCIILSLIFLYRINSALPKAIFKELYSFRTLHFVLMINMGIYFKGNLAHLNFPDYLYILIGNLLIIILWLSTLLLNNVYDLDIDKISNPSRPLVTGKASSSQYLNLSFTLSIAALIVSSFLGILPSILTLLFLISSLAYSMPPLRLRKKLFSTVFIGWGSCLAFFVGYFSHTWINDVSMGKDAVLIAILIFIAFSVGPLTKDFKDYQSDLQNGVRTFFTVYGIEKGTKIVSLFLGVSLLTPILLFHAAIDILFLISISVCIAVSFYFKKKLFISYLGYGSVLLYCLIRFTNVI